MTESRDRYAPFVLFEHDHDPGKYCLMLTDGNMLSHAEAFQRNDREPNGYAWADVALGVIRAHAPSLEGRLEMDPEAGTFVAYGRDHTSVAFQTAQARRVVADDIAFLDEVGAIAR